MSLADFADLQEALLYVFGPILVNGMFILIAGGLATAIGVVMLLVAARISR